MIGLDMPMPKVCIENDGTYSDCPMNRLRCAHKFAPEGYTYGEIKRDQTGKLPTWCPLIDLTQYDDDGK